ncbi:hypothetical protein CABS03_08127 [Colletotrichum abscissum]|uniref:Uncharacterized protein n=1 Tax=Colletotrichum abscissum TaxID=1671311 RepID=A0A9P9X2Z4_9PEZI|nr:hypothetical protein CABS02_13650 [Colletotrichum abscissum]
MSVGATLKTLDSTPLLGLKIGPAGVDLDVYPSTTRARPLGDERWHLSKPGSLYRP